MSDTFNITFAGASDTVTGSRHLVDVGGQRILLDCGMYQGYKTLRLRNWASFPVPPKSIDAVVLSHAHLDHSGYLPVLAADGFSGPIYCTHATRDLAEIMLLDSAHLLAEEAEHANRHGYSKHQPARPLYTVADVHHCLKQFVAMGWAEPKSVGPVQVSLSRAGHLLGAACVTLTHHKRRLVFSGDLGRAHDVLIAPPQPIEQADVVLIESTYGNRLHPLADGQQQLGDIIRETAAHGGMVLMPSFAVGRAQALLLSVHRLKRAGAIPDLPVYLDSPMAAKASWIHRDHVAQMRVDEQELNDAFDGAQFVGTPKESMAISALKYPSVIIAGSGMATGGRILHHLKSYGGDPRNHIVFPGFQVPGTRGAKILAGDKSVKIHGDYVRINARVSQIEGLSGHADADELLAWLGHFKKPPSATFVVHGERDAADALRLRIADQLGWAVQTVEHLQTAAV